MTSKKKTILHVIDTTGPGGAETVFLDLAEKMHIDGFENLALIKGPGWVENQLQKRKISYQIIAPHGFLSIPYYFKIYKLLKRNNVRYVQAHLLGSALTFSLLSFVTGIPVVATLHGQVDVNPNERLITLKSWILKKGLRKVVSVSGQLAVYLANRGLFDREQIEVIHNGIDVARYDVPDSGELRTRFALPEFAVLIGSIGNIRPAKDYANLIRAAAVIIQQCPEMHFFIAGHSKQPLQRELDDLVVEKNVQENIHFLGFLDNTPEFLAQLDAFVLSSSAEGFSISTLEAMAAKLPVIATKCGGPEEILRQKKDGILVDVASPDQLANAILSVVEKKVDTTQTAFERVRTEFSDDVLLAKYHATFTNTI